MNTAAAMIDETVTSGFSPILLEEMESIRLMNRTDTKYLTDSLKLKDILSDACRCGYRILETDGHRLNSYDSLYFDTEGLKMFIDHRNCHLVREKVRTRSYLSSGITFLEVKRKNNHGRTRKKRMEIPSRLFSDFGESASACSWLACHSDFAPGLLSPSVETVFRRITLVNPEKSERLTIDTDIRFTNHRTGLRSGLGEAVIIELKQDGMALSRMKSILSAHRVKPMKISKYCIGVTLTDPDARAGRFRQKARIIEKINKKLYLLKPFTCNVVH